MNKPTTLNHLTTATSNLTNELVTVIIDLRQSNHSPHQLDQLMAIFRLLDTAREQLEKLTKDDQ